MSGECPVVQPSEILSKGLIKVIASQPCTKRAELGSLKMCEREKRKKEDRRKGGEGSTAAVYLKVHVTETRRYTYIY